MVTARLQQRLWEAVRRSWTRIARFTLLAVIVGFAGSELAGAFFNGGIRTAFVHLVSLVVALAFGYGAAVTIGIFEAVRGLFAALGEVETTVRGSFGGESGWDRPPPIIDADH